MARRGKSSLEKAAPGSLMLSLPNINFGGCGLALQSASMPASHKKPPSPPSPQMMYGKVAFMALLGSAEAFNAAPVSFNAASAVRMSSPIRMAEADAPEKADAAVEEKAAPPAPPAVEYSEALPFLVRRASLGPKGALIGDVGFDPLGFTEVLPLVRSRRHVRCRAAAYMHSSAQQRTRDGHRTEGRCSRGRKRMHYWDRLRDALLRLLRRLL